ncbi:unnamed protein product [Owenia fusiformis]|uniref:Uncharacterized protein n=1 Tax=Owenia fusiformis TaxID=6347 RepID=A0A8J1XTX4_OWEFU|nr:unnamed protein product [Owenia fusiformis]
MIILGSCNCRLTLQGLLKYLTMAQHRINNPATVEFSIKNLQEQSVDLAIALNKQRKSNTKLCDVLLQVGTETIAVHSCVLVAKCPYFEAMLTGNFAEANPAQDTVGAKVLDMSQSVHEISSLREIVDFMYTGKMIISADQVEDIISLASLLLLFDVQKFCAQYLLLNLTLLNCLNIYALAELYDLKELEFLAKTLITSRFHDIIINGTEILDVPVEFLSKIISDQSFVEHCTTYQLINLVVRWANKSIDERRTEVNRLLSMFEWRSMTKEQRDIILAEKTIDPDIINNKMPEDNVEVVQREVHECFTLGVERYPFSQTKVLYVYDMCCNRWMKKEILFSQNEYPNKLRTYDCSFNVIGIVGERLLCSPKYNESSIPSATRFMPRPSVDYDSDFNSFHSDSGCKMFVCGGVLFHCDEQETELYSSYDSDVESQSRDEQWGKKFYFKLYNPESTSWEEPIPMDPYDSDTFYKYAVIDSPGNPTILIVKGTFDKKQIELLDSLLITSYNVTTRVVSCLTQIKRTESSSTEDKEILRTFARGSEELKLKHNNGFLLPPKIFEFGAPNLQSGFAYHYNIAENKWVKHQKMSTGSVCKKHSKVRDSLSWLQRSDWMSVNGCTVNNISGSTIGLTLGFNSLIGNFCKFDPTDSDHCCQSLPLLPPCKLGRSGLGNMTAVVPMTQHILDTFENFAASIEDEECGANVFLGCTLSGFSEKYAFKTPEYVTPIASSPTSYNFPHVGLYSDV